MSSDFKSSTVLKLLFECPLRSHSIEFVVKPVVCWAFWSRWSVVGLGWYRMHCMRVCASLVDAVCRFLAFIVQMQILCLVGSVVFCVVNLTSSRFLRRCVNMLCVPCSVLWWLSGKVTVRLKFRSALVNQSNTQLLNSSHYITTP